MNKNMFVVALQRFSLEALKRNYELDITSYQIGNCCKCKNPLFQRVLAAIL